MGAFALVIAVFLGLLFMLKQFLKESSRIQQAPAPASLPSVAAPRRAAWASFFPHKTTTLYFALPLDQARQMLINSARSPWISSQNSGIFADQRRYDVEIHSDTIVIEGPFGYRKTTLHTEGRLLTTPHGTALQLASGMSSGSAIMVGGVILFLFVAVVVSFGSLRPLVLIVAPILGIYGVLLFNVSYEGNLIADLCGRAILGVPWRR